MSLSNQTLDPQTPCTHFAGRDRAGKPYVVAVEAPTAARDLFDAARELIETESKQPHAVILLGINGGKA